MIYRLYITEFETQPNAAITVGLDPQVSFIFAPSNSDYQNFKIQINSNEAQLEDIDGNVMSPEAAQAFVATLP